jgi:hypothetical protein
MTAEEYAVELERRGVYLWLRQGRLLLIRDEGNDAVTPELLAELRRHRATLIDGLAVLEREGPVTP